MSQKLNWIIWFIFLLSAGTIIVGGLILLKTGENIGFYLTYAGFTGLAISGSLMGIVYGVHS